VLTRNNLWRTALNLDYNGSLGDLRDPHIPMLHWCMRQTLRITYDTVKYIGTTGNMTLIDETLERYERNVLVYLIAGAARAGPSSVALNLFTRLGPDEDKLFRKNVIKRSVSTGGLVEVAKLFYTTPSCLSYHDSMAALRNGHLRFVQWVMSESAITPDVTRRAGMTAAESGSMDLVRWLVEEQDCPVTNDAVVSAASAGDLEMLRWLHEQVGGDLQSLVPAAGRHGHLHVVEWLLEEGCQLNEEVMYEAAGSSNKATVAWLLDRGCPFVEEMLITSSCSNCTADVFQFLVETKHMKYDPRACVQAASDNSWLLDTVLHQVDDVRPSEYHMVRCVESSDIECVRNALAQKVPLGRYALTITLNRGECAMLCEALECYMVDGELSDDFLARLDQAVRHSFFITNDVVQVLAYFGYDVPEGASIWSVRHVGAI
jgi:hypothetical protein